MNISASMNERDQAMQLGKGVGVESGDVRDVVNSPLNNNAHLSNEEFANKFAQQYLDSFDKSKLVDWKEIEERWDKKWGKL